MYTIILPVFNYGCETWSVTLREGHRAYRLKMFQDRGFGGGCLDLRGVKNEETGEDCVMRCLMICTLHRIFIMVIKTRRIRLVGARSTHGAEEKCIQDFDREI